MKYMHYPLLVAGLFIIFTPLLMQAQKSQETDDSLRGVVLGASITKNAVSVDPYVLTVESRILEAINNIRRAEGLSELQDQSVISIISRRHSNELASFVNNQSENQSDDDVIASPPITHTGATFGQSHQERLEHYGVASIVSGENIIGQPLIDTILFADDRIISEKALPLERIIRDSVDAWMQSPQHRANILLPEYTHTGIGAVISGQHIIITQVFVQRSS